MADVIAPQAVYVPVVGTVTIFRLEKGLGAATVAVGKMTLEIKFRMNARQEITVLDDQIILGGIPQGPCGLLTFDLTRIAMVVVWTDKNIPRAAAWGILPADYVDGGRALVVSEDFEIARMGIGPKKHNPFLGHHREKERKGQATDKKTDRPEEA